MPPIKTLKQNVTDLSGYYLFQLLIVVDNTLHVGGLVA